MKRIFIILCIVFLYQTEAQNVLTLGHSNSMTVGDSLYLLGNYSKAINFYNTLNNTEQKHIKLAKCYEALGNTAKALQNYKSVISTNTKAILAKYNYGKLLFKVSNYKLADSIFETLSNEYPNNPNFLYQRGLLKEKQKDTTAILFFQKAYKQDENFIDAIYKIAKSHLIKRRFTESESFINKGLLVDSTSIRFLSLMALKQYHNKEYHFAIETFEKLLLLGIEEERLHKNLADSYFMTLKINLAIEQYALLINKYDDKSYDYHYSLGICYKTLQYQDKAKAQIELAIALKYLPLDEEYITLATIYIQEKLFKKGLEYFEKALIENSNNETASYQLAVASDNYFKDKALVLIYYERYFIRHGTTGKYRLFAKQRMSDLKKELHYSKD